MDPGTHTYIAAISNIQIYADSDCVFIATIDLVQDNRNFEFGGTDLFSAIQCGGDPGYFIHFISRCMYITQVGCLNDLIGSLIKIKVEDVQVTGIASLNGNEWFYPLTEFESLKQDAV